MKTQLLALVCVAVICTILTLGLWPFHAPKNAVYWLPDKNGIQFGKFGTAFSLRPIPVAASVNSGATVEIWLQVRRIWDSGTFLAFYRPPKSATTFRQSQTDLLFKSGDGPANARRTFYVNDVFRRAQPIFITLTSNAHGVSVYLDGSLVATKPSLSINAQELSGRLILAASPGHQDEWSGQVFGIAIYPRDFTPGEVLRNYAAWTTARKPEIEGSTALYTFDDHTGPVIHDRARPAVDLYSPGVYQVIDKAALEPFWNEFELTNSYWKAAVKNVVGFVPFGFCFYAYFRRIIRPSRTMPVTIILGTLVSLTIEILQIFLPTRDSGTTDIITNTLGTWIGAEAYRLLESLTAHFNFVKPSGVSRQ